MEKKRLKIAQIGIGHNHAQANMESLRKLQDYFEILGVVESDPDWLEKRGSLPCYSGLKWMSEAELFSISDLDAVAIETDGFDLTPTAIRCAERGLHIHMDKPGGESLEEFARLLNICEIRSLAIQLAYVYRYNPALRFAVNAVRNGWLGEIFEIHASMSRYDGDNPGYRKWLSQFKGGAMYIFAGYLVDIVISMLGEPSSVSPFLKGTRDDGLIDNGLAVMEYEKASATIRVSVAEVDGMKHRRLIVCGTNGTVEICPIEHPWDRYDKDRLSARLTLKDAVSGHSSGTHAIDCGTMGDRYAPQLIEFAKIIRGEMKNPFGFRHEYLVQKYLLLASACKI